MVVQTETQDRVRHLLKEALPMLCRSGLTDAAEFSVEALIGITLNKSDVFLVSIKETVRSDTAESSEEETTLELSVAKAETPESPGHKRKQHRKRRRSKNSPSSKDIHSDSDSENTTDDFEDNGIKREKFEPGECHVEYDNTSAQKDPNTIPLRRTESDDIIVVKQEPGHMDLSSSYCESSIAEGYGVSSYAQGTPHSAHLGSSSLGSAQQMQPLPGSSYSQPFPSQAGSQSPGSQATMTSGEVSDDAEKLLKLKSSGEWVCVLCHKTSTWKKSLKRHVSAAHLLIAKHVCTYCGQRFYYHKGELDQHKKTCKIMNNR